MKQKHLFIKTFGCQMNVHDSDQMEELLKRAGYEPVEDIQKADLIIVNGCSIRAKAEQKAYSFLGRLRKLKEKTPGLIIGLAGCLAQRMGAEHFTKIPYLDFIVGTHNIHQLPDMVRDVETTGSGGVEIAFREYVESIDIVTLPKDGNVSSYVTIMQGCNNFCAYCIVPFLRGREGSRESDDIINEIEFLSNNGVKEVTLLGQNVNSYGKTLAQHSDFATLLKKVNDVGTIERIRFTTSHPKDLSEELINCFSDLDKLCHHIHLPVQSGSDSILKSMNRKYTSDEYLRKVLRLREVCPDISITSDIIVGFPGEKDSDFQKTIDLMEKVKFDGAFSFKYSARPGTATDMYDDHVNEEIKRERLSVLQSLQNKHTVEKNKIFKGKIVNVLVEGASKNDTNDLMGRTGTNRIINFKCGVDVTGEVIPVRVTETYAHSLRGELLPKKEI